MSDRNWKLFIDQTGERYGARTIRELKRTHELPGAIRRIYVDGKDGKVYHVGWSIGRRWFDVYTPMRVPA